MIKHLPHLRGLLSSEIIVRSAKHVVKVIDLAYQLFVFMLEILCIYFFNNF